MLCYGSNGISTLHYIDRKLSYSVNIAINNYKMIKMEKDLDLEKSSWKISKALKLKHKAQIVNNNLPQMYDIIIHVYLKDVKIV